MQGQVTSVPAVFLMGPTASGKTDVAAALYDRLPVELISVDAAQVYCEMNIGTAKPNKDFLSQYPHHLINICSPATPYSAADFVQAAKHQIAEIQSRGKIPLFVGGTMFYFNALEKGMASLPSANPLIRRQLEQETEKRGIEALHQDLVNIDPDTAQKINPVDKQRVQRALEIYRISGRPPSELMTSSPALDNPLIKLTLFDPDRSNLHQRIERRFQAMLDAGLLDEVKGLLDLYPDARQFPSMRTVGYRQVIEHLDQSVTEPVMIANAVAATRQLAKRQLTWLRQQSGVVWFDATNPDLVKIIETYFQHNSALQSSGLG